MKTSTRIIIAHFAMTLLVALTACEPVQITGNLNVVDGNKDVNDEISDSQLYAGDCGTWDIAGRYNEGAITGRCQIKLNCGATFEVTDGFVYEDEFDVSQELTGMWVYEPDHTCDITDPDPYDACLVHTLNNGNTSVDCYNIYVEMTKD